MACSIHLDPVILLRLSHALFPLFTAALPASPPPPDPKILTDLMRRSQAAFTHAVNDPSSLPSSLASFRAQPLPFPVAGASFLSRVTSAPTAAAAATAAGAGSAGAALPPLPRLARFLLVASFLASYNPPKKDLTLFGRARWEGNGPKRKGGGTRKAPVRKAKSGSTAKVRFSSLFFTPFKWESRVADGALCLAGGVQVPQTLMGPKAFSLDRLIAIFGSLLTEHDRPKHADVLGTRAALEWEEQVNETMASAGVHQLVRPLFFLSSQRRA